MNILWLKLKDKWVPVGAQSKEDLGLDKVQNFGHTDSYTDGSPDKYATAAALKALKEYVESKTQ
ncbi:hypothetical protein BZG05_13005 [Salinivibrio kushneri]|uniref:hypothetical protein n=1 Tax=Salinivibrio kushneri TaxID=1908198 RepID=UPI00098994F2|nr:hypothetical protein [Salinivibrio kushneri]OOE32876.1 hypothetical protein BZG05_13005 [Salinivibrio kushneri]